MSQVTQWIIYAIFAGVILFGWPIYWYVKMKKHAKENPGLPSVPKMVFATQMGRLASAAIIYVPIFVLWAGFYFLIMRKPWFIGIASNTRGTIIMAVIIAPLIIGAIVQYFLRDYFTRKWEK